LAGLPGEKTFSKKVRVSQPIKAEDFLFADNTAQSPDCLLEFDWSIS
jgi:hypothetical protein